MPISIIETPEPLSEASLSNPPKLIASDAARQLSHELVRYCRGEVTGRSFLVSGHRGAGKTMLVAYALQQAMNAEPDSQPSLRPLFIPLHGPNLLPTITQPAGVHAIERSGDVLPRTALAQSDRQEVNPTAREEVDSEMQTALKQITLGLHRALAKELVRSYRAAIYGDPALAAWLTPASIAWMRNALELAAQLEIELYECPTPARLREYWERPGFLSSGVLGRRPLKSSLGNDVGFRELVAVSGVCEAYRRISGTFTQEEKRSDADEGKSELTLGVSSPGKDLFGPLFSVLTGALVGVGLRNTGTEAYSATISGILTALASAFVMKYSTTRTRQRSASRQYTFLYDLSVTTLDRVLPILVDRLRAAGLAPVFVVDELDKVDDLSNRMVGMVHHLKKFVAESAFFVFITDRSYFESFRRLLATEPFPVEHTYFGQQLYIVFRPRDFHDYVREVIRDPGTTPSGNASDAADYPLLPLILLHRSRMHPIDLRREIADLRDQSGCVRLRPGLVRSSRAFQFDLRIQLAIEYVLKSNDDFASLLEQEPHFRRLANDAMYYLSRRWADAPNEPVDLGENAFEVIRKHLVLRMGKDRPVSVARRAGGLAEEAPDLERVASSDCQFLLERVRDLASLLANDVTFRARLEAWNAKSGVALEDRVPLPVLNALDDNPFDLLLADPANNHLFEWNFYPSGRTRTQAAQARVDLLTRHADWSDSVDFIRAFGTALEHLSQ